MTEPEGGAKGGASTWHGKKELGPDEYSEALGMTPREHDRQMRKWYVLLGVVCFFAVFGEGILVILSKRRHAEEARRAAPPVAAPALSDSAAKSASPGDSGAPTR
jgi:hypothetical protein